MCSWLWFFADCDQKMRSFYVLFLERRKSVWKTYLWEEYVRQSFEVLARLAVVRDRDSFGNVLIAHLAIRCHDAHRWQLIEIIVSLDYWSITVQNRLQFFTISVRSDIITQPSRHSRESLSICHHDSTIETSEFSCYSQAIDSFDMLCLCCFGLVSADENLKRNPFISSCFVDSWDIAGIGGCPDPRHQASFPKCCRGELLLDGSHGPDCFRYRCSPRNNLYLGKISFGTGRDTKEIGQPQGNQKGPRFFEVGFRL